MHRYTGEAGIASYYEVAEFIRGGATVARDGNARAPYAFKGDQWVGCEDAQSLRAKAEELINQPGSPAPWCGRPDSTTSATATRLSAPSRPASCERHRIVPRRVFNPTK